MTALVHARLSATELDELVSSAPQSSASLTDDHRRSLSARFRAVGLTSHQRVDAWAVEQAGRPSTPFAWSARAARRIIASGAARRYLADPSMTVVAAVRAEIDERVARTITGRTSPGSLGSWLARCDAAALAATTAESVNCATSLLEVVDSISSPWTLPASDAYYDVSAARTTLRARRDVVIDGPGRIVLRMRAGAPGKSAGPGLRADMTIEALAHSSGVCAARYIGVWPDAGVCLAVDGTMADLRAGARDLVRTTVAQRRARLTLAA